MKILSKSVHIGESSAKDLKVIKASYVKSFNLESSSAYMKNITRGTIKDLTIIGQNVQ